MARRKDSLSVLTDIRIVRLHREGKTYKEIMFLFGVCKRTVYNAFQRRGYNPKERNRVNANS